MGQHHWRVRRFDEALFEHPTTEAELVALVRRAYAEGLQLRVRGSAHSVAAAIYSDDFDPERGVPPGSAASINIMLDRYREVTFFERDGRPHARVQAGRNVGQDPYGPGETSDEEAGLVTLLAERGLALPVLGGISHQTLAGFLGTGSMGASARYAFHDAITEMRVIDGKGDIHVLTPGTAAFAHFGVSMGLMGVLSEVTLRLEPDYVIEGFTSVQAAGDCEIDLFGNGDGARPSLAAFFERHDYSRLLYWPQKDIERVEIWAADRVTPPPPDFQRSPFEQFPVAGRPIQRLIRLLYTRVLPRVDLIPGDVDAAGAEAWLRDAIDDAIGEDDDGFPSLDGPILDPLIDGVAAALAAADDAAGDLKTALVSRLIAFVISLSDKRGGRYERKRFADTWHQGLPHDNQMDDQLMPVLFTELWLPLDDCAHAMRELRAFWELGTLERTGTFATEIYVAPESPFTLSAARGRKVLRIDPFVFWRADARPEQDYFLGYWELLRQFDARFHWGKSLSAPNSTTGVAYRRGRCGDAEWDEWLATRAAWDPRGIFLTRYWREHLGIAG